MKAIPQALWEGVSRRRHDQWACFSLALLKRPALRGTAGPQLAAVLAAWVLSGCDWAAPETGPALIN